jgi:hypothetical protein
VTAAACDNFKPVLAARPNREILKQAVRQDRGGESVDIGPAIGAARIGVRGDQLVERDMLKGHEMTPSLRAGECRRGRASSGATA